MKTVVVREVRAYIIAPTEMGADYHNQQGGFLYHRSPSDGGWRLYRAIIFNLHQQPSANAMQRIHTNAAGGVTPMSVSLG